MKESSARHDEVAIAMASVDVESVRFNGSVPGHVSTACIVRPTPVVASRLSDGFVRDSYDLGLTSPGYPLPSLSRLTAAPVL